MNKSPLVRNLNINAGSHTDISEVDPEKSACKRDEEISLVFHDLFCPDERGLEMKERKVNNKVYSYSFQANALVKWLLNYATLKNQNNFEYMFTSREQVLTFCQNLVIKQIIILIFTKSNKSNHQHSFFRNDKSIYAILNEHIPPKKIAIDYSFVQDLSKRNNSPKNSQCPTNRRSGSSSELNDKPSSSSCVSGENILNGSKKNTLSRRSRSGFSSVFKRIEKTDSQDTPLGEDCHSHEHTNDNELQEPNTGPIKEMDSRLKSLPFQNKFSLPSTAILLNAYTASLYAKILLRGRLYLSQEYVCFYANIFGAKTIETIPLVDVVDIDGYAKHNLVTCIKITTSNGTTWLFTSILKKTKVYQKIYKLWKTARNEDYDPDFFLKEMQLRKIKNKRKDGEKATVVIEDQNEEQNEGECLEQFIEADTLWKKTYTCVFEHTDLKQFFLNFFSDQSNLYRIYLEHINSKDINIGKWENNPKFGTIRQITFDSEVKGILGTPRASVQETQQYILTATKFLFQTITTVFGVPFCDYFNMLSKWEVEPQGENCALIIYTGVKFFKKTWLKKKIESNILNQSKTNFQLWGKTALTYSITNPNQSDSVSKKSNPTSSVSNINTPKKYPNGSSMIWFFCFFLVLFFLLYYKLDRIEKKLASLPSVLW